MSSVQKWACYKKMGVVEKLDLKTIEGVNTIKCSDQGKKWVPWTGMNKG